MNHHTAADLPNQLPAVITASATFAAAALAAIAAYLSAKRDRRRQLYGDAFKAVMSWNEMQFRVRRRRDGDDGGLIRRFHDIQEQISYYSGWIGSESWAMRQSYERFVGIVKAETRQKIQDAWSQPSTWSENPYLEYSAPRPDGLTVCVDEFLSDVRRHLSPFQVGKFSLWTRELWRLKKHDSL